MNPLCLKEVANRAYFSLFHFHRLFQIMVGYTLKEYIRKRRLTIAAYQLIYTDKRIIDISLDVQYETQESFSRAFKKEYSVSPGRYRISNDYKMVTEKIDVCKCLRIILQGVKMMEPIIKNLGEIKIIGAQLKTNTKNGNNFKQIPQFWKQFMEENTNSRIPNKMNPEVCYGICDDFDSESEDFAYIIAYEVTSQDNVPTGLIAKTLPSAQYAVFTAKGKLPDSVQNMVKYVYGEWLAKSKYQRTNGPEFELYDNRCTSNDDCEVDLYVPVKLKG